MAGPVTRRLFAIGLISVLLLPLSVAQAETKPFTCYPRPAGEPPPTAITYSGVLADELLGELVSSESHLPPAQALLTETRGDQIVVILLNDVLACPLPVDRDAWEAALRKVLGLPI